MQPDLIFGKPNFKNFYDSDASVYTFNTLLQFRTDVPLYQVNLKQLKTQFYAQCIGCRKECYPTFTLTLWDNAPRKLLLQ